MERSQQQDCLTTTCKSDYFMNQCMIFASLERPWD